MAGGIIKWKKSPGPDQVSPEIVKNIEELYPDLIAKTMNRCRNSGEFPDIWNVTKLILIEKPKKEPNAKNTYRPICLLDTMGKLLETLIKARLDKELEELKVLHDHQHGFRKGRSVVGAVRKVLSIPERIREKGYKNQDFCVMVTLDVENSFNSAPWDKTQRALKDSGISSYVIRIIQSYLTNRFTDGARVRTSCGVPQGSVLGPVLWDLLYNRILKIANDLGAKLVAYADGLAIVAWAKTKEMLKELTQLLMSMFISELKELGIKLATKKTEVVLLNGRRKRPYIEIHSENTIIKSSQSLKYMGVITDKHMRMTTHVRTVCDKANGLYMKLARIMPNIGGPKSRKRMLLANAVMSTILFGAPVSLCAFKYYEEMLERVNRRLAVRLIEGYTKPSLQKRP